MGLDEPQDDTHPNHPHRAVGHARVLHCPLTIRLKPRRRAHQPKAHIYAFGVARTPVRGDWLAAGRQGFKLEKPVGAAEAP